MRRTGRSWGIQLKHFKQTISPSSRQPPVIRVPRERVELDAVGDGDLLREVDEHLCLLCLLRLPGFGLRGSSSDRAGPQLSDGSLVLVLPAPRRAAPLIRGWGCFPKCSPAPRVLRFPTAARRAARDLDWEANPSALARACLPRESSRGLFGCASDNSSCVLKF